MERNAVRRHKNRANTESRQLYHSCKLILQLNFHLIRNCFYTQAVLKLCWGHNCRDHTMTSELYRISGSTHREVFCLGLGRGTISWQAFRGFLQPLQVNARIGRLLSHDGFLPNHYSFVILIFSTVYTDKITVAGWTALRMRPAGSMCRRRSNWMAPTSWRKRSSCLARSWPGAIPWGASAVYSGPSCR